MYLTQFLDRLLLYRLVMVVCYSYVYVTVRPFCWIVYCSMVFCSDVLWWKRWEWYLYDELNANNRFSVFELVSFVVSHHMHINLDPLPILALRLNTRSVHLETFSSPIRLSRNGVPQALGVCSLIQTLKRLLNDIAAIQFSCSVAVTKYARFFFLKPGDFFTSNLGVWVSYAFIDRERLLEGILQLKTCHISFIAIQ